MSVATATTNLSEEVPLPQPPQLQQAIEPNKVRIKTTTTTPSAPQQRKNNKPRLAVCPGEKFQGPFGEVEVGDSVLSEPEKLLKINQAFGHVTVTEDAIISRDEEKQREDLEESLDRIEEAVSVIQSSVKPDRNLGEDVGLSDAQIPSEPVDKTVENSVMGPTDGAGDGTKNSTFRVKCEQCDKSLKLSEIKTHQEQHEVVKLKFKCDLCLKSFLNRTDLNTHKKKDHKQKRKIEQCKFCERIFAFQHLVDKHIIQEHLEESGWKLDAFHCVGCEEKFATETLLNYHQKRSHFGKVVSTVFHEPKPCPLCQTMSTTLVEHMKEKHPTVQYFKCRFCPEVFTKDRTRKSHVDKCHRQVR